MIAPSTFINGSPLSFVFQKFQWKLAIAGSLFFGFCCSMLVGQTPVLGSYAQTTVAVGQHITISPSAAPVNTTEMSATTAAEFTGVLTVDPTTGVVTVVNPKQADTFQVTVWGHNSSSSTSTSTTFDLIVTDPPCGPGTFSVRSFVRLANAASVRPIAVSVGDFNEDGNLDFVASLENASYLSVRLGNGSGGFIGTSNIPIANSRAIDVGDVNNDGHQDIVSIHSLGRYAVRLGQGNGSFLGVGVLDPPFRSSTSQMARPVAVILSDLNNDGYLDMATANYYTSNISVRLNDGAGNFPDALCSHYSAGSNRPESIIAGDFNNDGHQDLIHANQTGNSFSVRLGNGSGLFPTAVTYNSGGIYAQSVVTWDLDGDTDLDLLVANTVSNYVSVFYNDGAGVFSKGATDFAVGALPHEVILGDFNGDGLQDFATANTSANTTTICLATSPGVFAAPVNHPSAAILVSRYRGL